MENTNQNKSSNFLFEGQAKLPLDLQEMLRLQHRAMQASADGIVILEAAAASVPIFYINPAFERITGYSTEEAIGRDYGALLSEDHAQIELNNLRYALQEGKQAQAILRSYRKDGSQFWGEIHIAPVNSEEGQISHYVGIITDVTERKEVEDQLLKQATHDGLTKLPNRLLLLDRITQALTYLNRAAGQLVALLFIDLDHFKEVNDNLGHDKGDILLKIAAERLVECVRSTDTVARLGGDEFVILLTSIHSERDIVMLAERLLKTLSIPYSIAEQQVVLSASIGISIYPKDGNITEILLKNADIAMYKAKETGRNKFHFFTDELNKSILQRTSLEHDLRAALEKNQLILHYQPSVDLSNGQIMGFEALLRWQHPQYGLVPPLQSIGLAEETGLIIPIGDWLIRTACLQVQAWQKAGFGKLSMAINLSRKQLKQVDFIKKVKNILEETGLMPDCLTFELTEGIIIENLAETAEQLSQLKSLGANIVVDDFGTGYSSLTYLKCLPVDKLKIDRTFIGDMAENAASFVLVKAIIALAKALQLKIIAEGVEQEEQLQLLREAGCDEMQGYYFSRPVEAIICEKTLKENLSSIS